MPSSAPFPTALVARVRSGYALAWRGTHGLPHWLRVRENGLRLARETGADTAIVELFALLHDACRRNEDHDPGHGRRGADLARELARAGELPDLGATGLELLCHACAHHTDGTTEGDVTVLTCWDADRLDLGRVGILPLPERLCTDAARRPEILDWAWRRSRR